MNGQEWEVVDQVPSLDGHDIVAAMAAVCSDRLNSTPQPVVLRYRSRLQQYRDRVQSEVQVPVVCSGREILASKAIRKGSAQLIEDRRRR